MSYHRSFVWRMDSVIPYIGIILILFLYRMPAVVSINDNIIWYLQGITPHTCNPLYESWDNYNYPLVPLKYKEINTVSSYNLLNTTGILGLGYGIPCEFTRSREGFFDKNCTLSNTKKLDTTSPLKYPFGYIMYNPDVRYSKWTCLGEEPRIARYHASYSTITMYTSNNYYVNNNNNNDDDGTTTTVDINRTITCSTVCVIGGQQIYRLADNNTVINSTDSVLCLSIDDTKGTSSTDWTYTMKWIEAEPLPYHVVGATAIYSNGTVLVIGGIRSKYDDTTSSILEADVDPNTCLPYNWRNYGYSSTSRVGNQKQLQNWTAEKDILENRTFLWVTEGPPAYPLLPGDIRYQNYPHIYIPSYYPSILTGGGITIPVNVSFNPANYTIVELYDRPINHETSYISLQPLHDRVTFMNDTREINSRKEVKNALAVAQNAAVSINLNLPFVSSKGFDYLGIFDTTMKQPFREIESPMITKPVREYRWIYHDGKYTYTMYSIGDILTAWIGQNNEIITGYDNGDPNIQSTILPTAWNAVFSFIGNTKDFVIMAMDIEMLTPYIAYSLRCTSCKMGINYASKVCTKSPFEGYCTPCSKCAPTEVIPSYLSSSCTRVSDAKCIKCTTCFGGSPLKACNFTSDTECDPELEALVLQPRWKRVPVSTDHDLEYVYVSVTISLVWFIGCIIYSIYKFISIHSNKGTSTNSSSSAPKDTVKLEKTEVTVIQIFQSSLFRRIFLSAVSYTSYCFIGVFTIFTYIYFNYALLSSILAEESNLNTALRTDNYLFIGKDLRVFTFNLCIIMYSSLLLSMILNMVWLRYQYQSISPVPFSYCIVFPWISLHHTLSMGFYRIGLVPLQKDNGTSNRISNIHYFTAKVPIKRSLAIYFFSTFCSDGIMFLGLVTLSDAFGGTISSARPLTMGIALCGIINILLLIYKTCLTVFIYNNPVLSKEFEAQGYAKPSNPSQNYENDKSHNPTYSDGKDVINFAATTVFLAQPNGNSPNNNNPERQTTTVPPPVSTNERKIIVNNKHNTVANTVLPLFAAPSAIPNHGNGRRTDFPIVPSSSPHGVMNPLSSINAFSSLPTTINYTGESVVLRSGYPSSTDIHPSVTDSTTQLPIPRVSSSVPVIMVPPENNTVPTGSTTPSPSILPPLNSSADPSAVVTSSSTDTHLLDRYRRIQSQLSNTRMEISHNNEIIHRGCFTYAIDNTNNDMRSLSDSDMHSTTGSSDTVFDVTN